MTSLSLAHKCFQYLAIHYTIFLGHSKQMCKNKFYPRNETTEIKISITAFHTNDSRKGHSNNCYYNENCRFF